MDSNQSPDVNSRLSSAPDSQGSLMSIFLLHALGDHLWKQTNSCLASVRKAKGMEEHMPWEAVGPWLKGAGQITAVPVQQAVHNSSLC